MGVLKSVEPTGVLGLRTRVCGNNLGGCESADHPKSPARPRTSFVFARLFGSGFAGLGVGRLTRIEFARVLRFLGKSWRRSNPSFPAMGLLPGERCGPWPIFT